MLNRIGRWHLRYSKGQGEEEQSPSTAFWSPPERKEQKLLITAPPTLGSDMQFRRIQCLMVSKATESSRKTKRDAVPLFRTHLKSSTKVTKNCFLLEPRAAAGFKCV